MLKPEVHGSLLLVKIRALRVRNQLTATVLRTKNRVLLIKTNPRLISTIKTAITKLRESSRNPNQVPVGLINREPRRTRHAALRKIHHTIQNQSPMLPIQKRKFGAICTISVKIRNSTMVKSLNRSPMITKRRVLRPKKSLTRWGRATRWIRRKIRARNKRTS
jgi:hypothetical protein